MRYKKLTWVVSIDVGRNVDCSDGRNLARHMIAKKRQDVRMQTASIDDVALTRSLGFRWKSCWSLGVRSEGNRRSEME